MHRVPGSVRVRLCRFVFFLSFFASLVIDELRVKWGRRFDVLARYADNER